MKPNCLILTILIAGCVLLPQIGCQKQAKEAPEMAPKRGVGPTVVEPPAKPAESSEPAVVPATTPVTKPKPAKKGPRLTFEKVVHDFGEIGPGTRNVAEFKFTNTGASLLKIGKIRSTCGCTITKLARKEYAPGENGTVTVTFSSGRGPGSPSKRVYVPSNDRIKPKITLTVKGKVVTKVAHKPKKLKLFLKDDANVPKITLTSLDGRPFGIKTFRAPGKCITANFDRSEKATKFVLETRVNIEKLKTYSKGDIKIRLTHPRCHMVTIPFEVLPTFRITPHSIFVRNAEPQKSIKKEVFILNNYSEDFEIESVSSKKKLIRVLKQEKVGNRYKFELEITPPAAEDNRRRFSDVFYVNIKGGEKLEIKCNGTYSRKKGRS